MKKIISLLLICMLSLSMVACSDSTRGYIEPEKIDHNEEVETDYFEAKVLEVYEKSILVEPIDGSSASKSADKIDVSIADISVDFELVENGIVGITYTGGIAESYPAQISGTIAVNHINNDLTNDVVPMIETIEYDGKVYNKSELSEATLSWLELSEEERMLSSYYPPEFVVTSDICDRDDSQEEWCVSLEAVNATPKGLTIACHQMGGVFTELSTGTYYVIQRLENEGFVDVEYLPQENDIAWTSEAWIIHRDATTTWDIDWEWLYGELPVGEYRIGKEIMNFRSPGDFEKEMIYAHFKISE